MIRVLHVIPSLGGGGGARSLRALVGALRSRGGIEQRVLGLRDAAAGSDAQGADPAGGAGWASPALLAEEIEAAEIVHIHFWNSPELYEALRAGLPPCRLLIFCHVAGDSPPQVLTEELIGRADAIVAGSPYTAELPGVRAAAQIPASPHFGRLRGVEPTPHEGFNVGYVGAVDSAKLHPRFVDLCAAIGVPEARFLVVGTGDEQDRLRRRAAELGIGGRFELLGHREQLAELLGRLDVFGYPLRWRNYSSTELVLQEAMYAGVPPVVLADGGAQRTVEHGRTGIVAEDERAYVAAIERLWADPELRRRLGRAAARHARASWSAGAIATRWERAYAELMAAPKRPRAAMKPVPRGAEAFVAGLGGQLPHFRRSLRPSGSGQQALEADSAIADSEPPVLRADGGLLDYRRRYPDDPHLRLWCGLALARSGHRVPASAELHGALALGLPAARLRGLRAAGVLDLDGLAGADQLPAGAAS